MELTHKIRLKKSQWVALDLLALSLFAGVTGSIFAMATGTWWPFGATEFSDWPLYAFFTWALVVVTVGLLIGCQLQFMGVEEEDNTARQPAPSRPAPQAGALARPLGQDMPARLDQWQPISTDVRQGVESEDEEPILATAGR